MKLFTKIFLCFAAALPAFISRPAVAQDKPDSLQGGLVLLDAKLDAYFAAIESASAREKMEECDFLIESVGDSLVRNHVASYLYSKFKESALMGDDAVAIYLTDNWFAPGKVHFRTQEELFAAKLFASVNRQSLLGMKAPQVLAYAPGDEEVKETIGPNNNIKVLFIYDTSCPVCRAESKLLDAYFSSYEGKPLEFIAFYAGADAAAWEAWREVNFTSDYKNVQVRHLWDPDAESDFHTKYGVLSTPRLFLIDGDGIIVGRGLDSEALAALVSQVADDYEYGSDSSAAIFDNLFDSVSGADDVLSIVKSIETETLLRDRTLYRHMVGDMLYYFVGKRTRPFRTVLPYITDSLILMRPQIWSSEEDNIKIVSFAQTLSYIAALSPEGSRIEPYKVPGRLMYGNKVKDRTMRLDKIGGDTSVIVFHIKGCSRCQAQLSAIEEMLKDKKTYGKWRFFLVDMDEVLSKDHSLGEELMMDFDLSSMPFIISTDSKGIITGKYLHFGD